MISRCIYNVDYRHCIIGVDKFHIMKKRFNPNWPYSYSVHTMITPLFNAGNREHAFDLYMKRYMRRVFK